MKTDFMISLEESTGFIVEDIVSGTTLEAGTEYMVYFMNGRIGHYSPSPFRNVKMDDTVEVFPVSL